MNHSCENTSLQNVSVENLQFTERLEIQRLFRLYSLYMRSESGTASQSMYASVESSGKKTRR